MPFVAAADRVGSAPGVLAFDSVASGGGRTITIVRFDSLGGIEPFERVDITDDIQTHALISTSKAVEVYSWNHVYLLDISVARTESRRQTTVAIPPDAFAAPHSRR